MSNKISGFYYSADNIKNFKFRVRLKEINKSIPLLNSEYSNSSLEIEDNNTYEENEFSWQEKFKKIDDRKKHKSNTSDEENKSPKQTNRKILTYIHDDRYENEENISNGEQSDNLYLSKKLYENYVEIENNIKKMVIVADMNDYKDFSSARKREHVLFILKWNSSTNCLTISPDFNNLIENPYVIELTYGSKQTFHYSIEPALQTIDKEKLFQITALSKISHENSIMRLRKKHLTFFCPPKEIFHAMITCEIVSGYSFEYDNIYVEYTIELPYGFSSNSPLKGRTQISSKNNNNELVHFGHVFDFGIDYNIQNENTAGKSSSIPQIYFEIISYDIWNRQRTEGYCYTEIPILTPGYKKITLNAVRPKSTNSRISNMTRFFIGGRHILKDITWMRIPSNFQGDCLIKFGTSSVNSGKLNIVISTIIQNSSLQNDSINSTDNVTSIVEKLHVDSIFKSVGKVLKAYKQAKEKLMSVNLK